VVTSVVERSCNMEIKCQIKAVCNVCWYKVGSDVCDVCCYKVGSIHHLYIIWQPSAIQIMMGPEQSGVLEYVRKLGIRMQND
jgi:hypothetical protein